MAEKLDNDSDSMLDEVGTTGGGRGSDVEGMGTEALAKREGANGAKKAGLASAVCVSSLSRSMGETDRLTAWSSCPPPEPTLDWGAAEITGMRC